MSVGDLTQKRRRMGSHATQSQVARRMGWYKETLVDVERGKIGITDEDADRLEAVLDEIEREIEMTEQGERKEAMVTL